MELIIGGAFQGKKEFAHIHYPDIQWTEGRTASEEDLLFAEGIFHLEAYIRRAVEASEDTRLLAEKLMKKNPSAVIVCQEVGYGVVPIEKTERAYREAVGRICTKLAGGSTKVTRVICGIGTVIKDG